MNVLKGFAGQAYFKTMARLSSLGELLGWEWLIYNPLVHLAFERSARRNAPPLVNAVTKFFPKVKRVVDFGCGTGRFLEEFCRGGFEVVGCEYSERLRRKVSRRGITVHPFDLSKTSELLPGTPYDLALCTEVAEHIPASLADALVDLIVKSASSIVFTAAQPGQGGTGHVNEQPREYWIEKFRHCGASYQPDLTQSFVTALRESNTQAFLHQNICIFTSPFA